MKFSPENLESTACPLCGSSSSQNIKPYEQYAYQRCQQCGLVYLSPRLTETKILDYYASDEFYEGYSSGSGYSIQIKALEKTFRHFLAQLRKRKLTGGRLLEIGCGYGYFLKLAKDSYEYLAGTDYSPEAVTHAQNHATIYCGGMEAIPADSQPFDIIMNFAVMEHIYNPIAFIKQAAGLLKSGGRLIIATPYAGGFWYRALGKRWPFFIPPEHVCLYDRKTITQALQKAGLINTDVFVTAHAWPVAAFMAKFGLLKNGKKSKIADKPIMMPQTIVCGIGQKP